ncbi:hypothetical protein Scep_011823 [Stephania cephalantha]|uniref:Uncharacterized protein n=1 Tax=Stephania cephalantha TaxID=152367 RepID=A0AAP0P8S8_9MAGN
MCFWRHENESQYCQSSATYIEKAMTNKTHINEGHSTMQMCIRCSVAFCWQNWQSSPATN